MEDREIIKAFEYCPQTRACTHAECPLFGSGETVAECAAELNEKVRDLIQRQQKEIDELTEHEARFAFDRIHYNIKELNLIQEGYNIAELKKRFRAEFEERLELGVDDVNWADWLDSIADEMWKEAKGETDDR